MAGVGQKPGTSLSSGQNMDAYEAMVARARALIPQLRERASKTEELRRLPPETERDLHDAGLFRIVQPKRAAAPNSIMSRWSIARMRWGRQTLPSHGISQILPSHHWMLGMFDPRAQDAVWGRDADALIASSFVFPAGRARKVEGGYVLSGHWPFSSGVDSCEWNMLAGVVASDDDADGIEYRIFLLTRMTTRSTTPGTRPAWVGPDRTMSRRPTPLLRSICRLR